MTKLSQSLSALLLTGLLTVTGITHAQAAESGHQIQFSVKQSAMVDNDQVIVRFNTVAEGDSAQSVTREINRTMQRAIKVLQSYPQVVKKTEQYSVYPVYVKQTVKTWRGRQSLSLTMDNQSQQLKVLEKLQQLLNYQSLNFTVSKQRREAVLKRLQTQAIVKFKQQAQQITDDFGANDYQFVSSRIFNNHQPPQPRPIMARTEMMSAQAPAPSIESGQSELSVTIQGTISVAQ